MAEPMVGNIGGHVGNERDGHHCGEIVLPGTRTRRVAAKRLDHFLSLDYPTTLADCHGPGNEFKRTPGTGMSEKAGSCAPQ